MQLNGQRSCNSQNVSAWPPLPLLGQQGPLHCAFIVTVVQGPLSVDPGLPEDTVLQPVFTPITACIKAEKVECFTLYSKSLTAAINVQEHR